MEREPLPPSPERESTKETSAERAELSKAELHELDRQLQESGERARRTVESEAISSREKPKTGTGDRRRSSAHVNQAQRENGYRNTMQHVQKHLSPASRQFSKVIHHNVVEKTSDVISATLVRPTSVLMGAVCAFVAVLTLYAYATYHNFSLSGFETIGAFIGGWIIGLAIDIVRSLTRRRP